MIGRRGPLGWRPHITKKYAFAHIGDSVVCDAGHIVGVVTASLYRGQLLKSSDFLWRNTSPSVIAGVPLNACTCAICGAPFVRRNSNGSSSININGKWVP